MLSWQAGATLALVLRVQGGLQHTAAATHSLGADLFLLSIFVRRRNGFIFRARIYLYLVRGTTTGYSYKQDCLQSSVRGGKKRNNGRVFIASLPRLVRR